MNNLFNEKILNKKASEEVNLDKNNLRERRKYLDKWINNLENGVLDKSKEEEFQGEFLHDIFTVVLNAVNKSDGKTNWNLQRETKTELDGQKADGVLGFFDNETQDIRAVIELKGAKVSLDVRQKRANDTRTPVEQAFGYAPKYGKNCQWVIVSNYREIRLYRSNDMLEYHSFFLEKLKDDLEFKKFIYIMSFNALVGTKTKKAKTTELSEEYQKNQIEIEKKFYNEYKNIRLHIYENMKKNNPTTNENILIEKVQKLLDRFLFICFCEDKELLPSNIYHSTVEKGKALGDIFETFKMLCNWINEGNSKNNISKFNGGLFKNDEILNTLVVDDEVFYEMEKISKYDFDSDLNENILGHIFEQSISDIEELKKKLNGEEFDNKKSKRKKDGIFYTPKYITKYIVENSIKNWLDDKRKELGEDELPELSEKDEDFDIYKKNYSKNYKKHIEFWEKYREAVRNIKILDPACGSGAFLITAFEFLLSYNKYLDDKIADLKGVRELFGDMTKEILENNIFGVDLNRESVEITKLSLWLKTANKGKSLATLENNIKCGNSLIDDVDVAGELAFNWEKEFPQVFNEKDIVIAREQAPLSKKIYHITTALHNSRISERMITYKVKKNNEIQLLTDEEEILISKTISDIAKKDKLKILAYNICQDHIHLLILEEESKIDSVIQKIKSITAISLNKYRDEREIAREQAPLTKNDKDINAINLESILGNNSREQAPLSNNRNVWTQKFGKKEIIGEEQLFSTIEYINNNREKHNLEPHKNEMKKIIEDIVIARELAPLSKNDKDIDAINLESILGNNSREQAPLSKKGFDVVVGNPPYVQVNSENYKKYKTQKIGDLYVYFFEKGIELLKINGYLSFITPNLFIKGMKYSVFRNFLIKNIKILEIVDKGDGVFEDVKISTAITSLVKKENFTQSNNIFVENSNLIEKISNNSKKLHEICDVLRGLEIGKDKMFINENKIKILAGEDIKRYCVESYHYITEEIYIKYKKDNYFFENDRVIIRETGNRLTALYLNEKIQQNRSLYSLKLKNDKFLYQYLLSIINSKLLQYFYKNKYSAKTNIFPKIRIGQVKELPIKEISLEAQKPFIEKADKMLFLNKELQNINSQFQRLIMRKFELEKLSTKLQDWHLIDFKEFVKELKKVKIKLTLNDEMEWEETFLSQKEKATKILDKINKTDNEIDKMVYELYGMTEEDIRIIEGS